MGGVGRRVHSLGRASGGFGVRAVGMVDAGVGSQDLLSDLDSLDEDALHGAQGVIHMGRPLLCFCRTSMSFTSRYWPPRWV